MQTFLPFSDFKKSFSVLDRQRLGKQRVEAKQILDILYRNKESRWRNHPAVTMWKDNVDALRFYHDLCIKEWINRGYKNNMLFENVSSDIEMPWWLGNSLFHLSHQSNLLRKDYEFYSTYFNVSDDWLYMWPERDKTFRVVIPGWAKQSGNFVNPLKNVIIK